MTKPFRKQRQSVAIAIAVAISLSVPPAVALAEETTTRVEDASSPWSGDTAGIPLVTKIEQAKPTSEAQAQAISDALEFAQAHPDDVGYPWIDPESGKLVLSSASAAGMELLAEAARNIAGTSVRHVAHSYGELEAIRTRVTTLLKEGVPDADLIYMTGPNPKANRVVIVVRAPSEALFMSLSERFGTDAIELRIDDSMFGAKPASSRQANDPPFWGGASIQDQACSDGIPWKINGYPVALLTAAHCFSTGGNVRIGDWLNVGNVLASAEENWNNVHGTRYYTGQALYRGDVALIRLNVPRTSAPIIYRGGVNSVTGSYVKSYYTRFAQTGDVLYLSGRTTGETGPYGVDLTGWDILYYPPSDVWARNVSSALSGQSQCSAGGDSGGALFSIVSGGVKAAGVFSGMATGGCRIYFTPIWDSYLALPGAPLLSP